MKSLDPAVDAKAQALGDMLLATAKANGMWTGEYHPNAPVDSFDLVNYALRGNLINHGIALANHHALGVTPEEMMAMNHLIYG